MKKKQMRGDILHSLHIPAFYPLNICEGKIEEGKKTHVSDIPLGKERKYTRASEKVKKKYF